MILLIDNFDSFTYNIAQAYETLGEEVVVKRNHTVTIEQVEALAPDLLVIGPGPGRPSEAGISYKAVQLGRRGIPVFGVCLGHQAIGEAFGATLQRAENAMHGKVAPILHDGEDLFQEIPQGFLAARYHSLVLSSVSLPSDLQVTAWSRQGEVMGLKHRLFPIWGVQFHPDSIATEYGLKIFENTLLKTSLQKP